MPSSRKRTRGSATKPADKAIEDEDADSVVEVDSMAEENAVEDEKTRSPRAKKRRDRSQKKKATKQQTNSDTKNIAKGESDEEFVETKEEDSKIEDSLECPHCNKKFASENGLEYHLSE